MASQSNPNKVNIIPSEQLQSKVVVVEEEVETDENSINEANKMTSHPTPDGDNRQRRRKSANPSVASLSAADSSNMPTVG